MDNTDAIPEFNKQKSAGGASEVGVTNMSALTSGPGIKSMREVLAIILVAVVVIGGTESALTVFAGAAVHLAQSPASSPWRWSPTSTSSCRTSAIRWSSCSRASASAR